MATHVEDHLSSLVGANISAAREARGLSQQEVATALNTSTSRVSGWERGRHLPSRKQQPAIAALLFDGDVTALFRENGESPEHVSVEGVA